VGCFTAGSSQRDREAAARQTTPYCATLYSALEGPAGGGCQRDQNKGGSEARTTERTICVVCRTGSKTGAQPRSAARSVAPVGPSCQRSCGAIPILPGRLDSLLADSALTLRWWSGADGWPAEG
jgi:hypothetical protein